MSLPTEKTKAVCDLAKLKVVIMGEPKSGKSSFAIQNPAALIIDTDNRGTDYLECYRVTCNDWSAFQSTLKEVADEKKANPKEFRFKTIVIDTVDMLWQRCREYVLKREGLLHESDDKGFGRTWDLVKTEFLKGISFICNLELGLWFVTHTSQKEVKIQGIKKNITTSSLPGSACSLVLKIADIICYIDVQENEDRILNVKSDDSLPTGDRTQRLKENIRYSNPAEGYEKFSDAFQTKEISK